jgi:hypothetical protein
LGGRVLRKVKVFYVLACRILGLIVVLCRGDQAAVVEVLVLGHDNAVPDFDHDHGLLAGSSR